MDPIEWTVELLEPTILAPNSTVAPTLKYSNQNQYNHHIRAVYISPTWDLTETVKCSMDVEVSPGEVKQLPAIGEIDIPSRIGGKQGFRIGVEASGYNANNRIDYDRLWKESAFRVSVSDSVPHQSLIWFSRNDPKYSTIRELIHNWGFDTREIYDRQDIVDEFRKGENLPSCVFVILLPDSTGTSNQQVATTIIDITNSHDIPSFTFKHSSVNSQYSSSSDTIIEFSSNDLLHLEEKAGSELLQIRSLEAVDSKDQLSNMTQNIRNKIQSIRENPLEFITSNLRKRPKEFLKNMVYGWMIFKTDIYKIFESGEESDRKHSNKEEKTGARGQYNKEKQLYPDPEDLEINRDQYESQEPVPVVNRPESDVIYDYEMSVGEMGTGGLGLTTVEGTIQNSSNEPIDFIDIDVVYFANDTRLGHSIDTVEDLEVEERKNWSCSEQADVLGEEPTHVEVTPRPQNRKKS